MIENECKECGIHFVSYNYENFCMNCMDEMNAYTDEGIR